MRSQAIAQLPLKKRYDSGGLKKIQAQLQQYYLNRSEADRQEEEAWADATQDAAIQAWDEEESSN
jgi:hypothetical protein